MMDDLPHILHVFPTFEFGGQQVRLARMINMWGARYLHTIIAVDGKYDAKELILDHTYVAFATGRHPKSLSPAAVNLMRTTIQQIRPDLLLTYNWGTMDWAMANSIAPIVRHIHFEGGFGIEEADRQFFRRRIYRRLALRRTEALIVPSHTLETIAQDFWHIPSHRIHILANGVDPHRFGWTSHACHPSIKKRTDETLVGTVAAIRPEKNLARLLRVFASVAGRFRTRLVIAGDGPDRGHLESLADTLGIRDRVIFTGRVTVPETVLQAFDIFALTSETEQLPTSLLEAMASGLPILATDVGDIRRTVAEANRRFVIARNDEVRLSAALCELIADPALRAKLAAHNQSRVLADFDDRVMLSRLEAILAL